MSNLIKFYLSSTLWVVVNTFTAGAVLQTFLMENGFSEELTNIICSSGQVISIIAMLLFSPVADRIKGVIPATARTYLLCIPIVILLFCVCLWGNFGWILTALLFLTIGLYSVGCGLQNSLTYKLPYMILDMRHYGRITAICGILTGVMGLLISLVLTWLQNAWGYANAMTALFLLCLPLLFATYILIRTMRPIASAPAPAKKDAVKINYFRFKPFCQLIAANFLRGFGTGILNVVVTVGYYCKVLDADSAAIVVVISNFTTFMGSSLYSVITGRIPEKWILLITCIGMCVSTPIMLIGNSTILFLIGYGLATTFWTVVNYSIPVATTQIADYTVMGQYSSGRLLLHTAGSGLAGFLCIRLIDLIGGLPTMILTGVCFLVCGISYFVYMKKNNLR